MPKAPLSIGFNVPFTEAIKAAERRGVVLPDVYYGELQGIARQKAFSIAGLTSLSQLEAVKSSLDEAMSQGLSFAQWKKNALESAALDLPKHRLDNIFRTNLQGNYMAGRWEQFQRNKDTRPYLMYDAINDSRVRPAHLALDNIIRPVNDPFWAENSPPNGYRCRCGLISLTEKQAQARSAPGNGLNNPARLPDGEPARADSGWEFNPADRMKGLKAAIKKADKLPYIAKNIESAIYGKRTLEKAKGQSISYVLENGRPLQSRSIEFAVLYDSEGVEVLAKRGGKSQVPFSIEEMSRIGRVKSATMVHNHPSGRSLSDADLYFTENFDEFAIIAAGHNDVVYTGKSLKKGLKPAYKMVDSLVKDHVWRLINDNKMTVADANLWHAHAVNSILAAMGHIEYSVENVELLKMNADFIGIVENLSNQYRGKL